MKNGKILTVIMLVFVALAVVLAGCFVGVLIFGEDEPLRMPEADVDSRQTAESDEFQKENVELDKVEEKDTEGILAPLKQELENEIGGYSGEWAIYVENLESGDKIEINNKKMVSASLIKLFIMGSVYEKIDAGIMEKDEVYSSLEKMIRISDNESSNILVSKLGGGEYKDMNSESFQKGLAEVNGFAQSIECVDTEQQRDMKDSRQTPIPQQNFTSVLDCGKFLSEFYHKSIENDKSAAEMLELLKGQTRRNKICAGVPQGVVCANKTGELSDVENDVGIVFSPGGDYIICVMSNEVPDTAVARKNIIDISQKVYKFFN